MKRILKSRHVCFQNHHKFFDHSDFTIVEIRNVRFNLGEDIMHILCQISIQELLLLDDIPHSKQLQKKGVCLEFSWAIT